MDEMRFIRNAVELGVGVASFIISLLCLCLSYLSEGLMWPPMWATLALGSLVFCIYWCFEDVIFSNKKKRGSGR